MILNIDLFHILFIKKIRYKKCREGSLSRNQNKSEWVTLADPSALANNVISRVRVLDKKKKRNRPSHTKQQQTPEHCAKRVCSSPCGRNTGCDTQKFKARFFQSRSLVLDQEYPTQWRPIKLNDGSSLWRPDQYKDCNWAARPRLT